MTRSSLGYDIDIWVQDVGRTSNGYTGIIETHDRHLCRRNWQWVRSKEFGSDVSKDRNGERWWLLTQWWMLLGDIRQNKKALKPSCRVEISSKPWLKSRCRPSSVSYSLGPLRSQACWRGERVSVGKEFWACWRNQNFGWGATEQALSRQEASCSPYDGSSFIPGWFLKSLENALGEGSSSGKNVLDPQAASNLHQ